MDTWWQTETGNFMITPLPSMPLKPGSATRPFPGIEVDVVDDERQPVPPGEEGYLVIKRPWPAMLRTIYKDPERYKEQYWSTFGDMYLTGDSAKKDEDGYIWVIGRIDDVIKVSGYRLGTAEVESALVSHPAVAEAAVIGVPDELRGNIIYAYCILRSGYEPSDHLADTLRDHVGHEMGPIAKPSQYRVRGQPAQDPQRQDHAPAPPRPGPRPARRGRLHAGRIGARSAPQNKGPQILVGSGGL